MLDIIARALIAQELVVIGEGHRRAQGGSLERRAPDRDIDRILEALLVGIADREFRRISVRRLEQQLGAERSYFLVRVDTRRRRINDLDIAVALSIKPGDAEGDRVRQQIGRASCRERV